MQVSHHKHVKKILLVLTTTVWDTQCIYPSLTNINPALTILCKSSLTGMYGMYLFCAIDLAR